MKNEKYHLNVGSASVLLLVVVFALTVFAVLSIRASYNELQMAEKNRDAVQIYYEADAKAEAIFGQISRSYREIVTAKGNVENSDISAIVSSLELDADTVIGEYDESILYYTTTVDYNRKIEAAVGFDGAEAKILKWKLASQDYGSYEGEFVEIWDGQIN